MALHGRQPPPLSIVLFFLGLGLFTKILSVPPPKAPVRPTREQLPISATVEAPVLPSRQVPRTRTASLPLLVAVETSTRTNSAPRHSPLAQSTLAQPPLIDANVVPKMALHGRQPPPLSIVLFFLGLGLFTKILSVPPPKAPVRPTREQLPISATVEAPVLPSRQVPRTRTASLPLLV